MEKEERSKNQNFEGLEGEGKNSGGEINGLEETEKKNTENQDKTSSLKPILGIGVLILGGIVLAIGALFILDWWNNKAVKKQTTNTASSQSLPQNSNPYQPQPISKNQVINPDQIVDMVMTKIEGSLNQRLEMLRKEIERDVYNSLNGKIDDLQQQISKIEIRLQKLKVENGKTKAEIENIEKELEEIRKKLKGLERVNKPLIKGDYPILGSLKVDEITPQFITINGVNYWIGDTITLVNERGQREDFTIIGIKPTENLMVVIDEWGNKYLVKLKST